MARLRVRQWWAFALKRSDRKYRSVLRLFRIEHAFRKAVHQCYHAEKTAQFHAQQRCAIELTKRCVAVRKAIDGARIHRVHVRCGAAHTYSAQRMDADENKGGSTTRRDAEINAP